jgi:hypothetical protein
MPRKDRESQRNYQREWERKHLEDPENRKIYNERKAAERRRFRKSNPDVARVQDRRDWLWKQYRVTPDWYDSKFAEQKGLCAICNKPESGVHWRTGRFARLAVDHNHDSGKARGLLCAKCNQNLHIVEMFVSGFAKPDSCAERALQYLKSYE